MHFWSSDDDKVCALCYDVCSRHVCKYDFHWEQVIGATKSSGVCYLPMSTDEGNTNSYRRLVRIRVDDELSRTLVLTIDVPGQRGTPSRGQDLHETWSPGSFPPTPGLQHPSAQHQDPVFWSFAIWWGEQLLGHPARAPWEGATFLHL